MRIGRPVIILPLLRMAVAVYGDVRPVRGSVSRSRVDDLDRVDDVAQAGDAQESEAGRRAVRVDRRVQHSIDVDGSPPVR